MTKNIIFDIGGVLVNYYPDEYIQKLGMNINKIEEANQILIKDTKWREYLNGNIKVEEMLRFFAKEHYELRKEYEILLQKDHQPNILYEIKQNTQILTQLSKKYDIYLLSNITKETFESIQEKFPFAKYINGGVYSYQEHISKPEKKIYQILLDRYSINPNETIYIDDKIKNVKIAVEMKMNGIHYKEDTDLKDQLGGYLIEYTRDYC